MTRWNHEKRRSHPHGLFTTLERLLGHPSVHSAASKRGHAAARRKTTALEGAATRTKM
jgi:hypothetical protein